MCAKAHRLAVVINGKSRSRRTTVSAGLAPERPVGVSIGAEGRRDDSSVGVDLNWNQLIEHPESMGVSTYGFGGCEPEGCR